LIERNHGFGCELYYDGKLRYSGHWENGEIDCESGMIFYPSGIVCFIGKKTKGKKEGYCSIFDEGGQPFFVGYYQKDIPIGYGKKYHRGTRVIEFEGLFRGSIMHGPNCKEYHPNGVLKYQGGYKYGKRHRGGKEYDPQGVFVRDIIYYKGERCYWQEGEP
jgi:antitoxin component YwqK of YwqJK toxin-antitoxin module